MQHILNKKFNKICLDLCNSIIDFAKETNMFDSITLFGSYSEEGKRLNKLNDIDLLIILKKMDFINYNFVIGFLEKFVRVRSNKEIGLRVEKRYGPFLEKMKSKITINIHAIIFDVKTFQDYVNKNPLAVHTFIDKKPIFGKSIHTMIKNRALTKEDIKSARLGIDFYLKTIETGYGEYLTVVFDKNNEPIWKPEKINISKEQQLINLAKSLKFSFQYIWLYAKQQGFTNDQFDDCLFAKRLLTRREILDYFKIKRLDKRARQGKIPSYHTRERVKINTLGILHKIRKELDSSFEVSFR